MNTPNEGESIIYFLSVNNYTYEHIFGWSDFELIEHWCNNASICHRISDDVKLILSYTKWNDMTGSHSYVTHKLNNENTIDFSDIKCGDKCILFGLHYTSTPMQIHMENQQLHHFSK